MATTPPVARRGMRWRALRPVALAALAVTCDAPTAPRLGRLAVQAEFRSEHRQLIGLSIDSIHIVVVRPPSTVVATFGMRFAADSTLVTADVPVTLQSATETFDVTLQLIASGQVVFSGTRPVTVTQTSQSNLTPPAAVPVTMTYTGPGANLATLVLTPQDTGITFGGEVQFIATARDSQNALVPEFYVSWSGASGAHTLSPAGLFRAGTQRGRVVVRVRAPNGVTDSSVVFIVPVATTVAAQAGSGQQGAAGAPLPLPLVARVTAADGGPVAGVAVTFAPATGGGTVDTAQTVTDSLGLAGTTVVLGPAGGAQTFTATVQGLAAATFTATATVTAPPVITLSLPDTLVGVGQAPPLRVSLSQAAPTGGLIVTVLSDSTAYLTVAAPGSISFAAGDTAQSIAVTGVALGLARVRASAPGYQPDTIFAPVIPPFLQVTPSTANVGVGASTTLTVAARPRPLAPLAVTVASQDPLIATATPGTLNFAAGQSAQNVSVQGVAAGTVAILATAPGYLQGGAGITVGTGGIPTALQKQAGDNQTGFIGDTLAVRPAVQVLDAGGAPVANVAVSFAVTGGGGSISQPAALTNASGIATLGSAWQLGATPGANALTASLPGFPGITAVVFAATGVLPPPVIQLSVFGSNVVGQARTGVLNVRLLQAAPAGGVAVALTSTRPGLLRIGSYASETGVVNVAQGDTLETITVFGDSSVTGIDTVIATAPGYTPDTLAIPVSQSLISLPGTLNVPLSQTVNLPINLSVPAPAGGVDVAVVSSDPAIVQVVTPMVTVPQGSQVANAQVNGVALGAVTVTATNPNYAPDASTVGVTAALNITATSVAPNVSFGLPITVQLESGGIPVGAPAGGVAITFSSTNAACVAAPAGTTIPQGQVNATVQVGYGGTAPAPCSGYVRVDGPAGFTPDSVLVNMGPMPVINIGTTTNIGSGLQRFVSASLPFASHGGTTVRITAVDPAVTLVAPNQTTVGTPFIDIPIANGSSGFSFYVQALEGIIADTVAVVATAPLFADDTLITRVWQAVYDVIGVNASATTLTADDAFQIRVGTPNTPTGTFVNSEDELRAGSPGVVASIINDSLGVADLVTTALIADSVDVPIAPLAARTPSAVAAGGVAVRYTAQGVATMRAIVPGMRAVGTGQVTVTAPSVSLFTSFNIGSGLQRNTSVSITAPAPVGGTAITLAAAEIGAFQLAPNQTTLGVDTLVVTIPQGSSSATFYIQGVEGVLADTVRLHATAVGFNPDSADVRVWQGVFDIIGVNASATTLTADDPFQIRLGTPSSPTGTFVNNEDELRAGSAGVTATVLNDSLAVAALVDSLGTADTLTTTVTALTARSPSTVATGGLALRYTAAGVTTLQAQIPGMRMVGANTVTVIAPSVTLGTTFTIGSGLQRNTSVSLSAPAPAGGLAVTLAMAQIGEAQIAPAQSALGVDTLVVNIPAGQTSAAFYIQGVEGRIADTVFLHATAPGFSPDSMSVRVWQPVYDFVGLNSSATTLTVDDPFQVRIGTPSSPAGTFVNFEDEVRFGSVGFTVSLLSNASTVAQLVTPTLTGDSVTVLIPALSSRSPSTVAGGGVALDYLTTGTTVVSASEPNARAVPGATGTTITVAAPAITIGSLTVGAGLQDNTSASLSAPVPAGGLTLIIRSNSPGLLQISPNAATAGADSIILNLTAGATSVAYHVQGVEGQTGAAGVTAYAPGFTDGTSTITVVQPAIEIVSLGSSNVSTAADDPFTVRVGTPAAGLTGLNIVQQVRAGGAPLVVTVTNTVTGIGQLVTTALTGDVVTVQIAAGQSNAPTSVATGGVAFDFLTAGTTFVVPTAAGYVTMQQTVPGTPGWRMTVTP